MKKQNYLKSTLCLLLGLVCHVAWAQTNTDGPLVTFTNVQQDGTTTFTLYINEDNELATSSSSAAELGDAAKFRAIQKADNKWAFYNEAKQLYMIWRGKNEGHNGDKGVLEEYNPTYCDWTVSAGNVAGRYYFAAKRSNTSKDGTLIIMKSNGAFDGWGNTQGLSATYSNLYNIESDEYTATLTDAQGTEITCSTKGFPTPVYSDATFSDIVWKDGNLAATVSADLPVLAFPVSSTEVTNATFISSFKVGSTEAGRFKWYADGSNVKVQRDATIKKANSGSYSWAIYAILENGAFNYSIKNVATGKYIYTEASYSSGGSHSEGTVTLTDTPTKFLCTTDGNNRFYYVSNSVNQYLSHNSVDDATGYLGVYASAHNGTTNSFHTPTYLLAEIEDFENGGIYTFVTARGWMGANERDSVISTARTTVDPIASASNINFQWAVYKSNNGNYYLYNLGKQKFMGVQSANNTEIAFVDSPAGKKLTFKQSSSAEYPIMFSTDNAGVVNHSTDHGGGLINWTGGWNNLNDDGSNHKVTLVGTLTNDGLKSIADLVEAYDKRFYVKAEVEGWEETNPNTHFGRVRVTSTGTITTKLNVDMGVVAVDYDGTQETTIDFTREYRGFEFQGYFLGEEELGKSFTLTEELKSSITEENPVMAKFTTTNDVTLFYDDDEFSYRIPAIATTSTGRLIAVSDYRHNLADIGAGNGTKRIDLVIRTSDDNGVTWSEKKTIAAGDNSKTGQYDRAFGDAAIAAVGQNIVVMAAAGDVVYAYATAENPNRMARIFSSDNGATWTHEEITTKMYNAESSLVPSGVAAFFGSGLLAVDTVFVGTPAKPRIYGALLVKIGGDSYNNFAVYSDDLGGNWAILGGSTTPIAKGDEPKVEILPNGQILLSARRQGGRVFNVFTYGTGENDKANGVGSWNNSAVNGCGNGGSNSTNGEIFCIDAKKADGTEVKLLLQSQPKGGSSQFDRKDVAIWYKEISASSTYDASSIAANWTEGLQVSTQQSAYSTMTLQNDGKIGFFFEEAPCYGDDYTKGYSMVYAPLSIESITKGNYFSPSTDLTTEQAINVVLTDAQGNEYHEQVTCAVTGVASGLTTKYPFITLGDNADLEYDGTAYTYTNTVTLPFKVSNEETTVWHNIYFPSAGSAAPVYLSANEQNSEKVNTCVENNVLYGNSTYNTSDYADNISWAIYNVNSGFVFKFKNRLTDKYIQVTGVANGNAQNAVYVDETSATVFELVPDVSSYNGDYALKAAVEETVGYLCATSWNYGYATHYTGNAHAGAWVKFVEAPDFETLIVEANEVLNLFGDGLGQYSGVSEENLTVVNAAKEAMENPGSVKLNTLTQYQGYASKTTGATLNMPKAGQFFRVAYDYGGNVGKLYMQGVASTVKGLKFTAETGNASIWLYYDGALYSYTTGQCLREVGDDRGLQAVGGKTTATFSASTRAKGKYNIACTSYVHANSNGSNYYTDHCSDNGCAEHDLILEEVPSLPVTIGSVGYATLYAPVALAIPEGVSAYTGTVSDEWLTLTEIEGGVIPANEGVILHAANAATYDFDIAADAAESVEDNVITGKIESHARTSVATGTPYTLQSNGDGGVVFKKYTGTNLNGFKSYLVLNEDAEAQAIRIRFAGEEDDTTGIEGSALDAQGSQLIYDLQGRRVLNPTKGMYIVNGKKVLIR